MYPISGFAQLLEALNLCLSPNVESFQLLFLQILFTLPCSFYYPLGSNDTNVKSFVIVPQILKTLIIFFSLFSVNQVE